MRQKQRLTLSGIGRLAGSALNLNEQVGEMDKETAPSASAFPKDTFLESLEDTSLESAPLEKTALESLASASLESASLEKTALESPTLESPALESAPLESTVSRSASPKSTSPESTSSESTSSESTSSESKAANSPLLAIGVSFIGAFLLFFYISYALKGWFFQDDFAFIIQYAHSIEPRQLLNLENFGRFVSRNVYWHVGLRYFAYHAEYFYLFNLLTILATSYFLYLIFSEKYGRFEGIVAALLYFALPATIESYAWLSNSQHLMAHFFVVLFVYFFDRINGTEIKRSACLSAILFLGFQSNIFMAVALSLPIFMSFADKRQRRLFSNYIVTFFGLCLFAWFFYRLSARQAEIYSTAYDFATLAENLFFYFKNKIFAALWLLAVVFGAVYAHFKKAYFVSWLFLASVAFFAPFAFFIHQRYAQYAALTYLFFLLAAWSFSLEIFQARLSGFLKCSGFILALAVFSSSLQHPVRHLNENPRGAAQKSQVNFLKNYARQNPQLNSFCFQTQDAVVNTTGVEVRDASPDWRFAGFGEAFSLFVSSQIEFELADPSLRCDANFLFKKGDLIATGPREERSNEAQTNEAQPGEARLNEKSSQEEQQYESAANDSEANGL